MAVLCTKEIETKTHNGLLKMINDYAKDNESPFSLDDVRKFYSEERTRIRNDYDDMYIVKKSDTEELVRFADEIYNKTYKFIYETIKDFKATQESGSSHNSSWDAGADD